MNKPTLANPIPKRQAGILPYWMLVVFTGVLFCSELKAIPEDWPSTDGIAMNSPFEEEDLQLSCIGTIQVSLDASGEVRITPVMLLVGQYSGYSRFKVRIQETGSDLVRCSELGKTLMATVTDTLSGQSCWSFVIVEDKWDPELICRSDTVSCTLDPFAIDYTEFINALDNCGQHQLTLLDRSLEILDCMVPRYAAIMHLQWQLTDPSGNTSSCSHEIYFRKSELDSIVFPPTDTVYCPDPDFSGTGVPTWNGSPLKSLCQILATHADDTLPVCGGMYKLRRLWTVIDWCTYASISQVQEILVADTLAPVVFCPRDSILLTPYDRCTVDYLLPAFSAIDACVPADSLEFRIWVDQLILAVPGQIVRLDTGGHTLYYIATDPCGNADTCEARIWVKDKVSPSMVCPTELDVYLDRNGLEVLTADQLASMAFITDNCCLDTVWIRRMTESCSRPEDTLFRDEITFCCEDLGDTLMIVLKAVDCSGNSNVCMVELRVQDNIPPRLFCAELHIDMPANDTIKVTARELLLRYDDNCSPSDRIKIAFSDSDFTDSCRYVLCSDLTTMPDTFSFNVYAMDGQGNTDSCSAWLIVTDTSNHCGSGIRFGTVSGIILGPDQNGMEAVDVSLSGSTLQTRTNDQGRFEFPDLNTGREYSFHLSNNHEWAKGISTQDIVRIQRHILGFEVFDHPKLWFAADVDRNGRISAADISWLRRLILQQIEAVPGNESWRFVNTGYRYAHPEDPLKESADAQLTLHDFVRDTMLRFEAIKVGDVSGTQRLSPVEERMRKSVVVLEERSFIRGELFYIDLMMDRKWNLEGMQLDLEIDPSYLELYRVDEFISRSYGRALQADEFNYDGRHLMVSLAVAEHQNEIHQKGQWLRLTFRARKDGSISESLRPGSALANEVYPRLDVPLKILFEYRAVNRDAVTLDQWTIEPNPFHDQVWIGMQSSAEETGTLSVFDLTGKPVINRPVRFVKGYNHLTVNANELINEGTYVYSVQLAGQQYLGKIVYQKGN
ncbi:MAG TPA: T9SS type A sorting domain-containing protein [Saprospiraceae bacterium]|nr:T9SS type A sorting domain-containing protein [Saprospiraceae bacterium]